MTDIDYSKIVVNKKGKPYNTFVKWSHYGLPVDQTLGNSRIWGDASVEIQKAVIDAIVAAAKAQGLSIRETAHVLAIARLESGFNPDAAAGTSSASGLGQFIDKTGEHYGLTASNRWTLGDQAKALVSHFIDNRNLAVKRGLGEEYIYKFHHDGPSKEFGGLDIAKRQVMPLIAGYEAVLNGSAAVQTADMRTSKSQPQSPPQKEQNMNILEPAGHYTVRKGDSLSKIAERQGVTIGDLIRANKIADPNRIRAGQSLTILGQEPDYPSV